MASILLKHGLIVTMEPATGQPFRGDILIVDDKIVEICPPGLSVEGAEEIDASNHLIIPGLIDAHVHTWQSGLRGIAGNWTVPEYMRAMHRGLATHFSPDDIYIANLVGSLSKLNAGVTSIADWCHNNPTPDHTDAAINGLEEAGIRALFLHGSPKPNPKPGQKHFSEVPMPRDEVLRLRYGRLASDTALVTMGLAILGPQYSTYEVTEQDYRLARDLAMTVSTHTGGGPMLSPGSFEKLIKLGLIDGRSNIVHANNFSDDLIKALVDAGASFTVTADVEMQMGFGDPLTGKLRQLGSPLSIGSDVEPAVSGDMFTNMRLTMNVQRNIDNIVALTAGKPLPDTATITSREALEWATINGARMMGMERRIGSLAPGKQADIVMVRSDDINIAPVHDPYNALVLQACTANVDAVLVAGRFVKRDGRLVYPDLKRKQALLRASGARILKDLGIKSAA